MGGNKRSFDVFAHVCNEAVVPNNFKHYGIVDTATANMEAAVSANWKLLPLQSSMRVPLQLSVMQSALLLQVPKLKKSRFAWPKANNCNVPLSNCSIEGTFFKEC